MEKFLELNEYDIIAYLMVGIAALIIFDLVLGSAFLFRAKWNTALVVGVLIMGYVGGHLVSIPAGWLFRDVVIHGYLKEPIQHLIPKTGQTPPDKTCEWDVVGVKCMSLDLWGRYFEPAPKELREQVLHDANGVEGSDLFLKAFKKAKYNEATYARMEIFQRLYLLFRNLAFISVLAVALVAINLFRQAFGAHRDRHLIYYGVQPWLTNRWWQFVLFTVLSYGLINRFLDFYRLYSLEVLYGFVAPARHL